MRFAHCWIWLLLFTALVVGGCGQQPVQTTAGTDVAARPTDAKPGTETEPKASPQPSLPKPAVAPKVEELQPELIFNASDYPAEYQKDDKQAEKKYGGKRVEVTGTIRSVSQDGRGWKITLADLDDERNAVSCEFGSLDPLKTALPGQTVRVRGTVSGVYRVLVVKNCRFTSVTGEQPQTFKAPELADLYKKDAEALDMKYRAKYLIVTGEIVSVTINEYGAALVTLTKKGDLPEVTCGFGVEVPADKDRYRSFAKGQKVRILGIYYGTLGCSLSMCHVLPAP